MKPGNLVRITRASIGVPKGTLALIVRHRPGIDYYAEPFAYWEVIVSGGVRGLAGTKRRYLPRDLEVVS